jgi:hypothetical protein
LLTGAWAQPAEKNAHAGGDKAVQTTDPTIERLLKKIEEMEAVQKRMQEKLDSLTAGPSATQQGAGTAVSPAVAAELVQADAGDVSAGDHSLGPVTFRGFTDFDYGRPWFEKLPAGGLIGSPNSFNIGDFDLFANARISEHWSVLGEMLVTSDFSNNFSVEMDRLLFSYKPNDYFNIGFGKFNTALGYYPNAFHRARYFQTATSRPIMFSDEDNGGILPVHNIGVTATGKLPSGSLGLHWVAEVSNGRSATNEEAPIQNFVDESNGKAVNVALYAKPESLHGFQAGFSVYHDTMHPVDFAAIDQNIFTGHAVYVGPRLEVLNEASLLRHAVRGTGEVYRSLTGYTQLSYAFGRTRPYARYEYQNVPVSDPVFGRAGRMNGPSVGVNRHISNYVGLKLQFGRLGLRAGPSANDFQAQLAFAF